MLFNATSGMNVEKITSTFTTDRSGTATVNCGFVPDLVVLHMGSATSSGYTYENNLCASFSEQQTSSELVSNMTWVSSSTFLDGTFWLEGNGLGVELWLYNSDYTMDEYARKTVQYTAIKYT